MPKTSMPSPPEHATARGPRHPDETSSADVRSEVIHLLLKLRRRDGVDSHQFYLLRATPAQDARPRAEPDDDAAMLPPPELDLGDTALLPRPELDPGDTARLPRAELHADRTRLLRSPAPRAVVLAAVLALALFAAGAAAARFWIHGTRRQTAPLGAPAPLGALAPAQPPPDAYRSVVEPVSPEPPAAVPQQRPDRAPRDVLGPPPGSTPKRAVASRARQRRAPEPLANAGARRQQLTVPAMDPARLAPTIATLAGPTRSPSELGKQTVRRFVLRELEQLRACYSDQLQIVPTLAGPVRVQFLISPSGVVTSSSAKGLGDAVDFCVAGAIRDIRFPPSESSVLVHYPFHFQLAAPERGARATPTIAADAPDVQRSPIGPGGS